MASTRYAVIVTNKWMKAGYGERRLQPDAGRSGPNVAHGAAEDAVSVMLNRPVSREAKPVEIESNARLHDEETELIL